MSMKEYLLALRNKIYSNKQKEDLKDDNLNLSQLTDSEINQLLEDATKDFFPDNGHWSAACFQRPNHYHIAYLPCHLYDDKWLASTLLKYQRLDNIEFEKILNFVKTSDLFKQEKHLYEQRVIEWQIKWMVSGGEGWLTHEEYDGDFINFHPNCDIGFRKAIIDTLLAIGINKDAIEEGIEKNANLWRTYYMKKAFRNQFDPTFEHIKYQFDYADEEHEEIWIKLRTFEYYQQHKQSVDTYGTITPEMQMTEEEVTKLNNHLNKKNADRIAYIDKCKTEGIRIDNIYNIDDTYSINPYEGYKDKKKVLSNK